MKHTFYSSAEYRIKQSKITKANWDKGVLDFLRKREERMCKRADCGKLFEATPSEQKMYCSRSCAAKVNNVKRGPWSEEVRKKMAKAATGRKYPNRTVAKVEVSCRNSLCSRVFLSEPWMKRKFCGNQCAMQVIGGRATSPRASKGKAGIRRDISDTTYFYSRWEANFARLLTYLNFKWVYAPKSFDIGGQSYTPDFYLPEQKIYVEVKNFLWKYSKERDEKFRKSYPDIKLKLLLKKEYLELEKKYSSFIGCWEYRNSKFGVEKAV